MNKNITCEAIKLIQLKVHGVSGALMEFAQARVIIQRLIAELETSLGAQCRVQAMLQKWLLAAKVRENIIFIFP